MSKIDAYRFELELQIPQFKFFNSSNSGIDYRGPRTILGLTSFINEKMGRGPTPKKVLKNCLKTIKAT